MVTGESVGIMKYKFQIYKIHLVFGHLSALFENITIKCAAMESRLKHAGWNKRADWNFPQKTINVQDLIRACRVIKKFEINKRACTFIRYSRVPRRYSSLPNKRAAHFINFLKNSNLHGLITSCTFY